MRTRLCRPLPTWANVIRSGTVTVSFYNLREMTAPLSISFRCLMGIFLLAIACHARERTNPKVDKLFAQWDRADSPGAAVVIVKDGAIEISFPEIKSYQAVISAIAIRTE